MKKSALILFIAFILLNACTSKKEEKSKYLYNYETVENDPTNTLIYTLENGLKVYMSVNKDEPRLQTYIAVRAGSKFDPSETTGLAHYLEHMLFKGTHNIGTKDWEQEKVLLDLIAEKYEAHKNENDPKIKKTIYKEIDSLSYEASKFAIANEYDKMISSLGAKYTNAYTSFDETVYMNDIPSNELEKWLMVEGERFKTLVLRLFHTELETVYEEFNMSQDRDSRWVYQGVLEGLFPNHPYGTQTTIGEGEHLKNPSMINIHNYFETYYRPNNVAICLAGDLDPDATVALIEKYFGDWEAAEVTDPVQPDHSQPSEPVVTEVFGPQKEMVYMGYKFDGAGSKASTMIKLIDMMLANRKAGLIDLNLNLKQKVLSAGSFTSVLNDHSIHFLYGEPKENQTLEDVADLMLEQIELIKKGEFDDWLIEAAINNLKLDRVKSLESNRGRAYLFVKTFVNGLDFEDVIFEYDEMNNITKEDVVAFANEHYGQNYAIAYKRMGESDRHSVPKPEITSIDLDRDSKSDFYLAFEALESQSIEPRFIDFEKDIQFSKIGDVEYAYVENKNTPIFNLYYIFDMGSDYDKELALAVQYLPYLGTSEFSPEDLKKEFYKLALNFDVFASRDKIYVTLSGLEENFEAGLELFEHVLANVEPNEQVYKELVNDILKKRKDSKLDKFTILRLALGSYAKYGAKNPFTDIIAESDLKAIDTDLLIDKLHTLSNYKHRIFYYGQNKKEVVKDVLDNHHAVKNLRDYPEKTEYPENDFEKMKVYFTNYDMQQVELFFTSKGVAFDPALMATAYMFNEYFGSGLSSIVFQEIREQKALAYSAYAYFSTPQKADEHHYVNAYVGTQSDKMQNAVDAMLEIMNEMPEAEMQFNSAKESIIKKLQTEWITGERIYWQYETAKNRGLDKDIRADIYEAIQSMELSDLRAFFNQHIADKNYGIGVIGNEKNVDRAVLKNMGSLEELSLEEIFGY